MRRIKFWVITAIAILCLISIRDKEVVLHTPDTKPLVAEAYTAPSEKPSQAGLPILPGRSNGGTSNPGYQGPDSGDNTASGPYGSSQPSSNSSGANSGAASPGGTGSNNQPTNNGTVGGLGSVYDPAIVYNPAAPTPVAPGTGIKPMAQLPVYITRLTPTSAIPGVSVIIQGAGFSTTASNNIVKFGSVQANSVTVVSVNQIRAVVPQGLSAGFTNVTVTVGSAASKNALFDVLKDSAHNVFIDNTANLLPGGLNLQDSSIVKFSDINGDNAIDLLIIDKVAGTVHLLVNDGSGHFADATQTSLPAAIASSGAFITGVSFGDVNNDGTPDILITYSQGQPVRLLLNSATGTFTDVTSTNIPALSGQAAALNVGDVNGDGYLDIVIANRDANDVLLINDGTGNFTKDGNFSVPASSGIMLCDTMSAGPLDMITTCDNAMGSSNILSHAYLNNGLGIFTDITNISLPPNSEFVEVFDAGDLEQGGNIDLVVGCYGQNLLLHNKGSSIFEDKTNDYMPTNYFHPTDIKLGDMNGDGYLDLVILGSDRISLFMNNNAGSFKETDASIKLPDYKSTPALLGGKNVQLADIDGDGALDVIIGGSSLCILKSSAVNEGPVLDTIGDKTAQVGQELTFNIHASDPNGDSIAYSYVSANLPVSATLNAVTGLFSWTPAPDDAVTPEKDVTFIATEGATAALRDSEAIKITVSGNTPPVLTVDPPTDTDVVINYGDSVVFTAYATDPDMPIGITWTVNGQVYSGTPDNFSTFSVAFGKGTHTVTVTATDSKGASSSRTWTVKVYDRGNTNHAPVFTSATPDSPLTLYIADGQAASQSFSVTVDDPDNHPIQTQTLTLTWEEKNSSGNYVSIPGSGTGTSAMLGLGLGRHFIRATVTDSAVPSASSRHEWDVTVTPLTQNHAPTAHDQSVSTSKNTAKAITLTANDPDAGDVLTYNIVSTTTHGTLTGTAPNLTYTPNTGYVGSDSFTFKVKDSKNADSNIATVSIIIIDTNVNHAPFFTSISPASPLTLYVPDNGAVAQPFSVTVDDPDNHPTQTQTLTLTWEEKNSSGNYVPIPGAGSGTSAMLGLGLGEHFIRITVTDNGTPNISASFEWDITVTPSVNTYILTTHAANGHINRSPDASSYNSGTVVTLTAVPDQGYVFSNWSGDLTGSANPATITMNSNKTVTANFTALPPLTITASAGTGGTINPSGQVSVPYGTNQLFTVSANSGYVIDQVLVDGAAVTLSGGTYTFTNVTANHTIAASFSIIPINTYTLTVNAVNGLVAKNPDHATYNSGDQVQLTATPSAGYTFSNWSGDLSGSVSPATITMNSNKTVTANFTALPPLTITASAGTGGTINPSGQVSVPYGTNQLFTVSANSGYVIDQVLVDGAAVTLSGGTYTFTNVTANHTIAASFTSITDQIARKAFSYFWNEADPTTGLVRDRLRKTQNPTDDLYYSRASVSATGFALASFAVAAQRYSTAPDSKWTATPQDLAARAELTLNTLLQIQASQNPQGDATWGKAGLFYHFVNMTDGKRFDDCEVSTIDTAIAVAGALTAGEYFKTINPNVLTKARQLYANVNWKTFMDNNSFGDYNRMYKEWMPDTGYTGHWDYTDESLMLYLLAIGSPVTTYAIDPEFYYSPMREVGNYGIGGKPMIKTWFGSLFTYQFAQAFFDFRGMHDARGVNWWQNSIDATIANRQFCIDQGPGNGYNDHVWGLSAEYGVAGAYLGGVGALPLANPDGPIQDGTVNPLAVAASIGMLSSEVVDTLTTMASDENLWIDSSYGFLDSFNKKSNPPVYADYFVGIDLGAAMLMISNYSDSSLIWDNFMNSTTRYGNMHDLLTQLNFKPDSDPALSIDLDDISSKSQFAYGYIDSARPSVTIKTNLAAVVTDKPYILALHAFMNNYAGNYDVTADLAVNGVKLTTQTFSHALNTDDPIIYIEIPGSMLSTGDNAITLTRIDGHNWLAFKNVELSSPVVTNTWNIVRSVYASEYRVDDTYYAGHADPTKYGADAYRTFAQALNIATNPYTDILFYMDDLTHDRKLTLTKTSADGTVYVDVLVNGQVAAANLSMDTDQTVNISGGTLKAGWNRITLKIDHGGGQFIIWNTVSLDMGGLVSTAAPTGVAAASFGQNKINLRWAPVDGASVNYNVYRSQVAGGPYTKINSTAVITTQYQDSGLQNNTAYYYAVTAFDVSDPSQESNHSIEISKVTGTYDIDYRDGKDPNALGCLASSQFTYMTDLRHDWTTGAVRKAVLSAGDTGWIALGGLDASQMNVLSIWINGAGGEKIEIGLQNPGSGPTTYAVTAAAGWQNLRINLSNFSGISLTNLDKLSIKNNSSATITILLDDVAFAVDPAGTGSVMLDVAVKNVGDNSLSTGISFDYDEKNTYAPARQYLEVKYNSPNQTNWKIWIYTKNENGDPVYMNGMYNGLMRSDGRARVALLWRVYDTIQTGGVACKTTSDTYSGINLTWNYIKDIKDSDWASANTPGSEYSVMAFGNQNAWAHIAQVPPGSGDRSPVNNTFYVYLGGEFGSAGAGDYSAKIYFDITHE